MSLDNLLKDAVGAIATGPVGFGVHFDVAKVSDDGTGADLKINEQSLAAAQAQNNSGTNEKFATLDKPLPKSAAKALSLEEQRQDKLSERYTSMLGKSAGFPGSAMRYQRTALKGPQQAPVPGSKQEIQNPLLRMQRRHHLDVRRTLNEIMQRKSVALNPQNLPQQAKDKIIETALQKGDKNTSLGPTKKAATRSTAKPPNVRAAFNKWAHALQAGSYIEGPSLSSGRNREA